MSETKTVVGTLAGITEKPTGWTTIEVSRVGSDYPLKLDTKKQELIELARAAGQSTMEWTYSEEDSGTPNPHRPGENYLNRRFEGVAPVGSTPENAAGSGATPDAAPKGGGGEGMTKEEWARKDSAGHKRACIAIAVSALSHTMPSDPSTEDLNTFLSRAAHLALAWHRSVLAERDDPTGEEVPF